MNIKLAGRTGARVGAISLVNKRMEMLRNLDYNDVGTLGGIPLGNILQEETIVLNDIEYTLKTFIQYFDDPADGIGYDDENSITADYKKARVEVSWFGKYAAAPVVAISNFVPKGIETITGGGTLCISVFDAQVQPVSLANIHIVNNEVEPAIDINVQTNDQGKITFPGSPSIGEYQITITKNNYSTAKTYSVTPENPDPDPSHLTILEGQTTDASFAIDMLSSLTIETLPNISFNMTGAKIIGKNDEESVYKYSETHVSNINGLVSLVNLEWDLYNIEINSNYDISASSPPEPISIEPNTANNLQIFLVPHASNKILLKN